MKFKNKLITTLTAGTLIAGGFVWTSNYLSKDDNYGTLIDYLRNDKKTNELVYAAKLNHNALQMEKTFDGKRKTNEVWMFYSLNKIPSRNNKMCSLPDEKNYHFAKGVPHTIYYLTSDTAIVGIKTYEQKFDGSVNEFEYCIERFAYDTLSEGLPWTQVDNFYQVKTESCSDGDDCINSERIISTNKKGTFGRTFDETYQSGRKLWNKLLKDWSKK